MLQHLAGPEQAAGLLDLARPGHSPAAVRRAALLALGSTDSPEHAPGAAHLVSDADPLVRVAAVQAVGMTDPTLLVTTLDALPARDRLEVEAQARWVAAPRPGDPVRLTVSARPRTPR